jgi:ATP/maltotriose-dependent transcriptional regulator MalT
VAGAHGENFIVAVPRGTLGQAEQKREGKLSRRELEILFLAARGLSNRQIASSLSLSEATIKRHLANTYKKIGVASRGEATRKALSKGWFTTQEITQEDRGG